MSERLPENTRHAHQLARKAGAQAVAALPSDIDPPWEPRSPTVAERAEAARAKLIAPPAKPADRGPRGPIGPSGGGPSLDEVRSELKRRLSSRAGRNEVRSELKRQLSSRAGRKRCGGAGLFGAAGSSPPGAYEKAIVAEGGEGLAPIALESRVFGPIVPERVPAAGLDVYGSPADPPRDRYGKPLDFRPAAVMADPRKAELVAAIDAAKERSIRRVVETLAAEAMAPERRKLERLETAVRRAIELIQPSGGSFVGTDPMRALAVLRECLIPETEEVPNG